MWYHLITKGGTHSVILRDNEMRHWMILRNTQYIQSVSQYHPISQGFNMNEHYLMSSTVPQCLLESLSFFCPCSSVSYNAIQFLTHWHCLSLSVTISKYSLSFFCTEVSSSSTASIACIIYAIWSRCWVFSQMKADQCVSVCVRERECVRESKRVCACLTLTA